MMVHTYSLATPYATIHDMSWVPSDMSCKMDSGHLQTALMHLCQFDQASRAEAEESEPSYIPSVRLQ